VGSGSGGCPGSFDGVAKRRVANSDLALAQFACEERDCDWHLGRFCALEQARDLCDLRTP
jgi:hypothetical protein